MKIGQAIEIILGFLPNSIDLTESGKFKSKSKFGTKGYYENSEANINILVFGLDSLSVQYYSECDQTFTLEYTKKLGNLINIKDLDKVELEFQLKTMFEESIMK